VVVVEHFLPLCVGLSPIDPFVFVRLLARQNRPQGGDASDFDNHCVRVQQWAAGRKTWLLTAFQNIAIFSKVESTMQKFIY